MYRITRIAIALCALIFAACTDADFEYASERCTFFSTMGCIKMPRCKVRSTPCRQVCSATSMKVQRAADASSTSPTTKDRAADKSLQARTHAAPSPSGYTTKAASLWASAILAHPPRYTYTTVSAPTATTRRKP